MLQVLDGLAAAHQIGVVHRDLGPSNIFLMPRQRGRFHVKILDFGLARSLAVTEQQSELTQQGTLMGKPAYVAPEALTGQAVDGRSDIFACGILLFRMLAGAFRTRSRTATCCGSSGSGTPAARPSIRRRASVVPDVPVALDRITSRAMRVRVADRYPTVEAMQEDLLEVETTLVGEISSRADWSTSRPGIPSLLDGPSRGSSPPRLRGSTADATPRPGPSPRHGRGAEQALIFGAARCAARRSPWRCSFSCAVAGRDRRPSRIGRGRDRDGVGRRRGDGRERGGSGRCGGRRGTAAADVSIAVAADAWRRPMPRR